MNGNLILRIIVLALGLFVSAMVVFRVLTDYGNNLSNFFKYLALGLFLVGFLKPRFSAYLLLISCAYLDLLKRCLLMFGRVYFGDVITVLSLAPLLFAGICGGLIYGRIRSGRYFSKFEVRLFGLSLLMGLIVLVDMAGSLGSFSAGVVNATNSGVYIPMLVVAGMLFPTSKEQNHFIRAFLIVFIPVALYSFKQAIYGFSTLEIMYMKSGLTRVTDGLDRDTLLRPFSTLNSPHAFSVVMVFLFAFSFNRAVVSRTGNFFYWVLSILYLTALIPGYTRTSWAMAALIPICLIAFRKPGFTLALYGITAMAMAVLVVSSSWFLGNLHEVSLAKESDSDWVRRAGTLTTMSERFTGFRNWSRNPAMWSWFGLDKERSFGDNEVFHHDKIGSLLIDHGAVGLFAVGVLTVFGLYIAHSKVWSIRDRDDRNLAVCYLSIIFVMIASSIFSGGGFGVFPLNCLFWFVAGALAAIVVRNSQRGASDNLAFDGSPESTVVPGRASFGAAIVQAPEDGRLAGGEAMARGFPFRASGKVAIASGSRGNTPQREMVGLSGTSPAGGKQESCPAPVYSSSAGPSVSSDFQVDR